jgi:SAM-dependent methyltransferase
MSSHALREWLQGPRGQAVLASETVLLREALEDCFGWDLLQVGAWGEGRELLSGARTRSQAIIAAADPADPVGDLQGRLTQLPIASDSVDTVLMPHTLEFEVDPYSVLREADRILVGEGKLLVLGFVPQSVWGLRAMSSRRGFPPGLRRLISERRLRDWLRLLGYDLLESRRYLFELPYGEAKAERGARALKLTRPWWYPLPGGAYLLKARKRVQTLTPIRPRLLERRSAVLGGLTDPVRRSDSVHRS